MRATRAKPSTRRVKIAVLGIPAKSAPIDLRTIIFNMLTIKGIYGREMYETWYKMSVMLDSGLDISPVITHRFSYDEYEKGFAAMTSGNAGKVILDWTSLGCDARRITSQAAHCLAGNRMCDRNEISYM